MSVDATLWAWKIQGVTIAEKLILLSLADRANDNNRCFPSFERIMQDTCIGGRNIVIKSLKSLEDKGYIKKHKQDGRHNIYELLNVDMREKTSIKSDTSTSIKSDTSTSIKSDTLISHINLPIEPLIEPIARGEDFPNEPHTDFLQIRESYSKLARAESEMTGFTEYKTLVANKQLPPLSKLFDDISKRFEGREKRFNPSMKRYLAEQMWTAKIEPVEEKIISNHKGYDDDYQRQVAQRVLKRREERRNARASEDCSLNGYG